MSPTSRVPGAAAVKSRPTRSGVAAAAASAMVVSRYGRGWQATSPNCRISVRTSSGLTRSPQRTSWGVHPPVAVGPAAGRERRRDERGQPPPAGRARRLGPGPPVVETPRRHTDPRAHLADREASFAAGDIVDEFMLVGHRPSLAKKA